MEQLNRGDQVIVKVIDGKQVALIYWGQKGDMVLINE
jgi:hypothetical protein